MWYNIYKTHKGKVSYIACIVIFAVIFSSFLTFWILSFIISFLCNLFCQLSKIPSDKFFMFPLLCPILSWFYSLPLYPLMGMGILRPIIEEHWLWLLILGDSHLFWERNSPTWAFFWLLTFYCKQEASARWHFQHSSRKSQLHHRAHQVYFLLSPLSHVIVLLNILSLCKKNPLPPISNNAFFTFF